VKILDPEGHDVPATVIPKVPGHYVKYDPSKKSGEYSVNLLLSNQSLTSSKPFPVKFEKSLKGDDDEDLSIAFTFPLQLNMGSDRVPIKVLIRGFGVRGGKKLTGKPVRFFVRFKDAE